MNRGHHSTVRHWEALDTAGVRSLLLYLIEERANEIFGKTRIRVEKEQVLTACDSGPGVSALAGKASARQADIVFSAEVSSRVRRIIVGDDNFQIRIGLPEEASEEFGQVFLFIERRDDDADGRCLCHFCFGSSFGTRSRTVKYLICYKTTRS